MSLLPVIESKITDAEIFTAEDGRCLKRLHIKVQDFQGEAGQFVMIRRESGGFHWAFPYMIQDFTAQSLEVLASRDASLFPAQAGESVALWGANGQGYKFSAEDHFLAEPATVHLILPLLKKLPEVKFHILGKEGSFPAELLPSVPVFSEDMTVPVREYNKTAGKIFMALNIETAERILPLLTEDRKQETFFFVAAQMSCGIGACRSCYLHSPDIQTGIPVCCNGPFIPLNSIDFAADKKIFIHQR